MTPPCDCHGEPMLWHTDKRYKAGGFHHCRIRRQELLRERYHNLSGVDYSKVLLYQRRYKALTRRRHRGG